LRKNSVGSFDRRSQKRLGTDDSKIYCLSLRERTPAGISFLSATRSLSARRGAGRSAYPSDKPRHGCAHGWCSPVIARFLRYFFFSKKKNSVFFYGGEGAWFWLSVAAGRTSEGRPVLSPPCYLKIGGGTHVRTTPEFSAKLTTKRHYLFCLVTLKSS